MIRSSILGIPLQTRHARRWFVSGYWLAVAAALAVLFRFPVPPDATHWTGFLPLLLTLAVASNLPLLLGGFSFGGAVGFYEGQRCRERAMEPNAVWRVWTWLCAKGWRRVASTPEGRRQMQRFLKAVRPVDEREAQLRDRAHHVAHRQLLWMIYMGAVAYLAVSAAGLDVLARFGFVLLELLLVASMSLPQSWLLWHVPDDSSSLDAPREAQCEPN